MSAEWKDRLFQLIFYEAYLLPTTIPPYFLMAWRLIKQNDSFFFFSNLLSYQFGIFYKMESYPPQQTL
jgi:hypothetical protein